MIKREVWVVEITDNAIHYETVGTTQTRAAARALAKERTKYGTCWARITAPKRKAAKGAK